MKLASIVPLPPIVWRSPGRESFAQDRSAAAYLRRVLPSGAVAPDILYYLEYFPAGSLLWVALTRIDTPRLGSADQLIPLRLDIPAVALASDHAGTYIIFASDDIEEAGVMAVTPQTNIPTQPIDPTLLQGDIEPSVILAPTPAPADEEEEKRAARGGAVMDDNPANAVHAFNIRPDVQDTPSGTAIVTTMKSQEYQAFPDAESARAHLAEMLEGNAPESTPQPAPEQEAAKEVDQEIARDVTPTADPVVTAEQEALAPQQADDSTHRQEAEMKARNGEDFPDAESARAYLAEMLEGSGRDSVAEVQQRELAHDAGEERDMGGRGMM